VTKTTLAVRRVEPEWLDELPADDPRALRSRKELRWINFLMGNERWILRQLARPNMPIDQGIIELGAGNGDLCRAMQQRFPEAHITGLDLQSRPQGLPSSVDWLAGDCKNIAPRSCGVLVMNLFLHHFPDDDLTWWHHWLERAEVVVMSEPLRRVSSHRWGRLMGPLLHEVTRHDMHVSIDAGLIQGEWHKRCPDLADSWAIAEWEQWPGAYRSVWRKK
jgi:hypothetical protein